MLLQPGSFLLRGEVVFLPDGFLRHHGHRLLPQLLSVCTAARAGLLRLIIPALAAGHDLLEARGLALSLPGELEEIGVDLCFFYFFRTFG